MRAAARPWHDIADFGCGSGACDLAQGRRQGDAEGCERKRGGGPRASLLFRRMSFKREKARVARADADAAGGLNPETRGALGLPAHARPLQQPLRARASAPARLSAQGCAPALNPTESTARQ
jgi:hypothetical protein